jgi:Uma2 family endonuclease
MKWTREEYYRLGDLGFFDGRRVERIHGEIIEMSPINWSHVVGTGKTGEALRAAFAGVGTIIEQGPHPTDDSDPHPDVRVIPGRFGDYTDHPTTALLLVEVSDTTLSYDLTTKAELYATAGITDYWVLDLTGRQLHVFRDPLHNASLNVTTHQTHDVLNPGDAVSPLAAPHATIRVADLLP